MLPHRKLGFRRRLDSSSNFSKLLEMLEGACAIEKAVGIVDGSYVHSNATRVCILRSEK